MERGELEVFDSFSGLLDLLTVGARSGGAMFASPSMTLLRDWVHSLERQLTADEQKLKVYETGFLGWLMRC